MNVSSSLHRHFGRLIFLRPKYFEVCEIKVFCGMNLILLSDNQTKQIDLFSPRFIALGSAVLLAVVSLSIFLGYIVGNWGNNPEAHQQQLAMQETLNAKEIALQEEAEYVRNSQEKVNAMARRLGQLQARMIRLDAMGGRLTEMAGMESSEFNFDEVPPQGGPENAAVNFKIDELDKELSSFDLYISDREHQLGILDTFLGVAKISEDSHPKGSPAPAGYVSSFYGQRVDPFTGKKSRHTGIDIAGYEGANIVAVASGVVTWVGDRFGYGETVEINHGNGYSTRYAHNKVNLVAVGDQVEKGDIIALMGKTGRATGPNLHFEVLKNGQPQNPIKFVRGKK